MLWDRQREDKVFWRSEKSYFTDQVPSSPFWLLQNGDQAFAG